VINVAKHADASASQQIGPPPCQLEFGRHGDVELVAHSFDLNGEWVRLACRLK